jgi:hypothetical protein
VSHWYNKAGEAVFEVPKAKGGGTRKTTIADARKMGLYPSVTTVLGILDKPQLGDWKLEQMALAAFNSPANGSEPFEVYHQHLLTKAFEQVSDAADLGTAIHAALESHFKGQPIEAGMDTYVEPVARLIDREGIAFTEHELRLVNAQIGYAGTTDAVISKAGQTGILDFKSRKTKPGIACTPWETEPLQIAAYGVAKFGHVPEIGANVYISTTEKGRVEICWHSYEDLVEAWKTFQSCVQIWQYLKSYRPPQ